MHAHVFGGCPFRTQGQKSHALQHVTSQMLLDSCTNEHTMCHVHHVIHVLPPLVQEAVQIQHRAPSLKIVSAPSNTMNCIPQVCVLQSLHMQQECLVVDTRKPFGTLQRSVEVAVSLQSSGGQVFSAQMVSKACSCRSMCHGAAWHNMRRQSEAEHSLRQHRSTLVPCCWWAHVAS